jgi:cell division protein FtsI/penicillin-binding protein 2
MGLFKRKKKYSSWDVDTVFLDNKNMPLFDRSQKEGTIEQTINRNTVSVFILITFFIIFGLSLKALHLQLVKGASLVKRSENNRLDAVLLFARRGIIADRNGELLAWNSLTNDEEKNEEEILEQIPDRLYTDKLGMGHILGYVSYPQKDNNGNYWQTSFVGRDGIEKTLRQTINRG